MMNSGVFAVMEPLIGKYAGNACNAFEGKKKKIMDVITNKKVPEYGWSDADVESFLYELSAMDSNNFPTVCGVGERESRFASTIVARRHYWMGHGIGRSGDITALQPKAAGSSLINRLANEFVLDMLKCVGAPSLKKAIIVPMATGMSLSLCLSTLRSERPESRYVIWSRIDQKSCFKCILAVGLTPVIIDCKLDGEQLVTDVNAISDAISSNGADKIVCILSTTSCFAPRAPDSVEEIGKLCAQYDIPHVINNAYGIQCPEYLHLIELASKSRVDVFVSSTDKNFMVPVGGSIIAGFNGKVVDKIGKMYPGRGSACPSLDVFITLLNIGKKNYGKLLDGRKETFSYLKSELKKVASSFNESVISVPENLISIGLTLRGFEGSELLTEIGSMLFRQSVSGARVVNLGETNAIEGHVFHNWGSHSSSYPCSYLTAAASIGITKEEIDVFVLKLTKILLKIKKNLAMLV